MFISVNFVRYSYLDVKQLDLKKSHFLQGNVVFPWVKRLRVNTGVFCEERFGKNRVFYFHLTYKANVVKRDTGEIPLIWD